MGRLDKHFLPDFFIPGAAKCGTTTLHDLFEKHPQISMSKIKEPGYWKNKKFNDFSELEISNYKNLFTNKSVLNGESSTAYMFHDSFIKNIKKHYKTYPKFIFILRNPIDRYESHFNWMKGLGLEKNNIDNNISNGCIFNFREYEDYPKFYFEFGFYYKWIMKFVLNFGKENIKLITLEDLIHNKISVLNSCYEFLGVNKINDVKDIRSNKSKKIIFPTIFHFLRKSISQRMNYTKIIKYVIPSGIRNIIKQILIKIINNWVRIDLHTNHMNIHSRKKLKQLYYDDVKKLKSTFEAKFSMWKDFK